MDTQKSQSRNLILFVLLCLPLINARSDSITIAGDPWCPFNCEPQSSRSGYMVEIAKNVFAKSGHRVEYYVLPWARAIEDARHNKLTGIIGAYVADAPDFIFPKNELAISVDGIFVMKTNKISYKDFQSIETIKVGVIKGYAYSSDTVNTYIKKYGDDSSKIQSVYGDNALELNIKKLTLHRIDAIIENPAVFWYNVSKLGMQDKFRLAGILGTPKQVYIAFSPSNPHSKEYAQILSEGIDIMRKSGELKTILKRYGVTDWR